MNIPRFYHPGSIEVGEIIRLNDTARHHIAHVLRLTLQDPVILFNGQGGEFSAFISKIDKRNVWVTIEDFDDIDRESPLAIHLAQGIARGEKMDFIIQKAVELGIKSITPLITERGHIKLSFDHCKKRMNHWQGVMISACEQCRRNKIPTLSPITDLSVWIKQIPNTLKFVLHHRTENTLSTITRPENEKNEITLLVGPEGGLSPPEIEMAVKQKFHELKLGPRILRTETAALAAISALQLKWGDF